MQIDDVLLAAVRSLEFMLHHWIGSKVLKLSVSDSSDSKTTLNRVLREIQLSLELSYVSLCACALSFHSSIIYTFIQS